MDWTNKGPPLFLLKQILWGYFLSSSPNRPKIAKCNLENRRDSEHLEGQIYILWVNSSFLSYQQGLIGSNKLVLFALLELYTHLQHGQGRWGYFSMTMNLLTAFLGTQFVSLNWFPVSTSLMFVLIRSLEDKVRSRNNKKWVGIVGRQPHAPPTEERHGRIWWGIYVENILLSKAVFNTGNSKNFKNCFFFLFDNNLQSKARLERKYWHLKRQSVSH